MPGPSRPEAIAAVELLGDRRVQRLPAATSEQVRAGSTAAAYAADP